VGRALKLDLPYVKEYRDRTGRVWRYFRRRGYVSVRLPGEPGSRAFVAAYNAALAAPTIPNAAVTAERPAEGTFAALRLEYLSSAEYRALSASWRREMGYVIDRLASDYGSSRMASLERKHVLRWRDALKDKPGAANKMLRTVKALLVFAVDRGHIKENPAQGIKMLKLGRWRAWTDAELAAFEERWPLGTLERTGYALALYTSQRRADLVALKWSSIAGKELRLTQGKTGKAMVLRLHGHLVDALAAFRPVHSAETILAGKEGKPLNPVYFGHIMAAAIAEAGLPDDCLLHGLRKTTARILAELGMKSSPVTGHLTDAMQREYERDADQRKMGSAAIVKWEKAGKRVRK
jgi:integrase